MCTFAAVSDEDLRGGARKEQHEIGMRQVFCSGGGRASEPARRFLFNLPCLCLRFSPQKTMKTTIELPRGKFRVMTASCVEDACNNCALRPSLHGCSCGFQCFAFDEGSSLHYFVHDYEEGGAR